MKDSVQPQTAEKDAVAFAAQLIGSRQNTSAKRLFAPGPDAVQVEQLFRAAAAAPDHGQQTPWRFIIIPAEKRALLGEVFAVALKERDPNSGEQELADARSKANRAPLLIAVVARLGPCEPHIPPLERMVSVGCAVQNILLTAHSMGFGSGLASGRAMSSPGMRRLFGLASGEEAICFINIGTVSPKKPPRERPLPEAFVSTLEDRSGAGVQMAYSHPDFRKRLNRYMSTPAMNASAAG